MMLLRLLPFIYALLFILTRRIDVKVHKAEELTVKVNFNIFALLFSEDKIKKISIKSMSRFLKNARHIYKPIRYIISKSDITFLRYEYLLDETALHPVLKDTYAFASNQFLLLYLSSNAKSFRITERKNRVQDINNNTIFDINIHFSLSHLIISALLLLYYIVKNNLKRVLKNV